MNLTPEYLLQIIGKQHVLIEALQAQLKGYQDAERQHERARCQPPAWAQKTAETRQT